MRAKRVIAAAIAVTMSATAVAVAQTPTNTYDLSAKVPAGGSKAKPKITGFSFNYFISDAAGNVPQIVKTYKFLLGGAKVTTSAVKDTCTAASINARGDDSKCKSGAEVGTGTITAVVGQQGQPLALKAGDCTLKLTAYNAGTNKVALFLAGGGTEPGASPCLAPISQAIDAKWANSPQGAALTFTVPDTLLHQAGLDIAVTAVKTTWKKRQGKNAAKKTVGYFASVGCGTRKQRSASVTFTAENGGKTKLTKNIGTC